MKDPEPAHGLRAVLAGAPLTNDNRGVEALGRSVVDHLLATGRVERLSVLDDGWGVRTIASNLETVGARNSRRWHRRESWARVRFDQSLRGLGNPVANRFSEADVILDLSGGDSFTDLYGPQRLATVCAPKDAAIRARRPLVLLPQTFGPFQTEAGRLRAQRIVRASHLAYSRDAWSHAQLTELGGSDVRPGALREGVDVAFALEARAPDDPTADRMHDLASGLVVGVNVSGLLRSSANHAQFGLTGDYLSTMTTLVQSLVRVGAFVVLVAHVHGVYDGEAGSENDATAIGAVQTALTPAERARTWMLPTHLRAAELKWCIARTAWFTGSRMHATIASLSSGVATFGYAYSDKTRGVFDTCGVADHTADAREISGDAAVAKALASFDARDEAALTLSSRVPPVVDRAHSQLDDILDEVRAGPPLTRGPSSGNPRRGPTR